MNQLYFRVFTAGLFISACNPLQAGDAPICKKNEISVFSCGFKNKKTVSVCASRDNAKKPYIEYRFGSLSGIEMRYRAADETGNRFHRAEVYYASNAEKVLWFKNHNILYFMHFPMRGGPLLEARKGIETLTMLQCKGGWSGVRGDFEMQSKFIIEHGEGTEYEMSKLWEDK